MKYPKNESSTLELKQEVPTKQQIVKSIIGFCNMYGGSLVVGVSDTRDVIGLDETQVEQLIENIHRSIYDACTPTIIPAVHAQRIEDKILIVVDVSEGMTKPYFLSSAGLNEGTYVRVGTQTVKATPQMIRELQWQSLGKRSDEMPVYSAKIDDLDIQSFEGFLAQRKQQAIVNDTQEMLRHYDVVVEEHMRLYPSIGGMLLFGKNPQKFLSESFIICTHFLGVSGRDVVATRDCTGNLFQQYNDCISFILSRLNRQFKIEGLGPRKETLEVPEEAIREVVMNAIVHRNYQIAGPTKISIYDDRIEVFSPGNFPGPLHTDHLQTGVTYIRNIVITRIFRELGHIEKLGSGFITLFASYRERGLPRPVVHEGMGFVKCILPRPTSRQPVVLDTEEEKLIQLFHLKKFIKTQDVVGLLSISKASANRLISHLAEQGIIIKEGKGPSTYYRLRDI